MIRYQLLISSKVENEQRQRQLRVERIDKSEPPEFLGIISKSGDGWVAEGTTTPVYKTRADVADAMLARAWQPEYDQWMDRFVMEAQRNDRHGLDRFTGQQASYLYDILVQECGADPRLSGNGRAGFIHFMTDCPVRSCEFRFCGDLGFGGKFWVERNHIRVNCYSEDLTPERKRMIARANHRLQDYYLANLVPKD